VLHTEQQKHQSDVPAIIALLSHTEQSMSATTPEARATETMHRSDNNIFIT